LHSLFIHKQYDKEGISSFELLQFCFLLSSISLSLTVLILVAEGQETCFALTSSFSLLIFTTETFSQPSVILLHGTFHLENKHIHIHLGQKV